MTHVLASSDGPIFPITTSLAGCREGSYTTRLYKPQENICHSAWDITPTLHRATNTAIISPLLPIYIWKKI